VLIAASRGSFKLMESRTAMNAIRTYAAEDAHVIYGAAYDESLGDQMRVTVIATGLSGAARRQQPPLTVVQTTPMEQAMRRTGTDNLPVGAAGMGGLGAMAAMGSPMGEARGGLPTSYAEYDQPKVWRSGRTHAAAKVEALSSNGMDEIEIPAFLRRQAD